MDSILQSVKKDLGIAQEYTHFDEELIMNINSIFSVLRQLGVGPVEGFKISNSSDVWGNFIDAEDERLEYIKTYISKRVKILFDPPLNSAVLEATKTVLSELEWRINVDVDKYISDEERAALSEQAESGDG